MDHGRSKPGRDGDKESCGEDLERIVEDLHRNACPGEELSQESVVARLEELHGSDDAGASPALCEKNSAGDSRRGP